MKIAPERSWFEKWWKRLRSIAISLGAASVVLLPIDRDLAVLVACTAVVVGVYALIIRPSAGA